MEENKTKINNKENLKTVKTYMSDMADTVRQNEISVIKVALAEQNKHEREDLYRKIEGTTSKKVFWAIGGIILIAVAIGGTYYLIKQKQKNSIPTPIIRDESIISYDETFPIEITAKDNLSEKINLAKKDTDGTAKSGTIKYFPISTINTEGVSEKITTADLFLMLSSNAPQSLIRSLSDSFMIGTYTKTISTVPDDPNNQPKLFIIFQSKDYDYTYAGMFDWEKNMANDMLDLFSIETKESRLKLVETPWKDIVVNNKDARVLVNESGKNLLYYLFIDKTNLIITSDSNVIKEIVSRLMIKNMKPL